MEQVCITQVKEDFAVVDRYSCRGVLRNSGNCNNSIARGNIENKNCSCSNDTAECGALRKKLQVIDFSIIDTVLYLDAYPSCREALKYYHKLKNERKAIVEALSNKCNMPVTSFNNSSEDEWNWTNVPWPWEISAN